MKGEKKKTSWVARFVEHIKENWKSITCDKILPCRHDAGPGEANLSYSAPGTRFCRSLQGLEKQLLIHHRLAALPTCTAQALPPVTGSTRLTDTGG